MSATQKTPNYNLPIYTANDTLNFNDYNNAMTTIDTQMKVNASSSSATELQVQEINETVQNVTNIATEANTTASQAANDVNTLEAQVNVNTSHLSDVDAVVEGLQISGAENKISINQNRMDITQLQTKQTSQQTAITNLNGRASTLENEYNELSGEVAGVSADLANGLNSVVKNVTGAETTTPRNTNNTFTINGIPGQLCLISVKLPTPAGQHATVLSVGKFSSPSYTNGFISGVINYGGNSNGCLIAFFPEDNPVMEIYLTDIQTGNIEPDLIAMTYKVYPIISRGVVS